MVKKLKVVDVAQAEEAPKVEEPIVDKVEEPESKEDEPTKETIEEPTQNIVPEIIQGATKGEEIKPEKKTKATQEIVCEHCNKKMLMKTYKYSHQKVCSANIKELPIKEPTPPPLKQPLKEPLKQTLKEPKKQRSDEPTASFDAYGPPLKEPPETSYISEWNDLRQQRQMVRQQRVKSLISQAI